MAYLDHNATSPVRPEARAAVERALAVGGNPSSIHAAGRASRLLIEEARNEVAAFVGAAPKNIVFTSGGTEANVLALAGAIQGAAEAGRRITRLFVSAIEHDSVLASAAALTERNAGLRLEQIPVDVSGVVNIAEFGRSLREGKGRALVAVMAANNETGVVQPIDEIATLVRNAESLLHVDAVQSCGKSAVDFVASGADYMSLSAHKLGGPQGTGALIVRENAPLASQLCGGAQEGGHRAGTENLVGIAGFGAVTKALRSSWREEAERTRSFRDRFEVSLKEIDHNAVVFGSGAARVGNTSNFCIPGIAADTVLMALDLDGVMVSSGAACSSGRVRSSHVLAAMNVPEEVAKCAVRISFGWNSAEQDTTAAIASLTKLRARVLARAA